MKKTKYFVAFLALVCTGFSACKKGNDDKTIIPKEISCPMSKEDLEATTPPTYTQLLEAYETVISKDSSLLNDKDLLFCKIYKNINDNTGQLKTTNSPFFGELNKEEWELFKSDATKGMAAVQAAMTALTVTEITFPCDNKEGFHNNKSDAFRHAFWNAFMSKMADSSFARKFATAHEALSENTKETAMDLHNNKVGRDIAAKYKNATPSEIAKIISQQRFIFVSDPSKSIPKEYDDALIFFAGNRAFDGTFTGSLTNPDSGGPWDATFTFSQCDNTLRGKLKITRGSSLQERRFTGTIDSSNNIKLNIESPHIDENPNGVIYCKNMVMTLNSNTTNMSGSWTSSSCSQGGTVTLSR